MKAKKPQDKQDKTNQNEDLPGYPSYPPEEDIFNNEEEADLNPDDLKTPKNETYYPDTSETLEIDSIETGDDLDVPGSEQDDSQEAIGSEDEENNYWSLGGDDMENLEEDNIDEENQMS
jgi:hypothetical protein